MVFARRYVNSSSPFLPLFNNMLRHGIARSSGQIFPVQERGLWVPFLQCLIMCRNSSSIRYRFHGNGRRELFLECCMSRHFRCLYLYFSTSMHRFDLNSTRFYLTTHESVECRSLSSLRSIQSRTPRAQASHCPPIGHTPRQEMSVLPRERPPSITSSMLLDVWA